MPKKVSELFSNLFSKSRQTSTSSANTPTNEGDPGQLTTDAAPLDDAYESQLLDDQKKEIDLFEESPDASSGAVAIVAGQRTESKQLPARNIAEPIGGHSNEFLALSPSCKGSIDVEPYQMPGLDVIRDPGLGSPSVQPVAVNNTQGYNVFQFSQISGLHIGSVYNIKNEAPAASTEMRPNRTDEPFRRTKTIEAMMKSNEPLSHRPIDVIATHLGEGWRDIVRQLGFSDGQIEQMMEDHYVKGVKEVIYQFLLDFSRNEDNATIGYITRLLWKNGRRECVYILKEEFWKGFAAETAVEKSDKSDEKAKSISE